MGNSKYPIAEKLNIVLSVFFLQYHPLHLLLYPLWKSLYIIIHWFICIFVTWKYALKVWCDLFSLHSCHMLLMILGPWWRRRDVRHVNLHIVCDPWGLCNHTLLSASRCHIHCNHFGRYICSGWSEKPSQSNVPAFWAHLCSEYRVSCCTEEQV